MNSPRRTAASHVRVLLLALIALGGATLARAQTGGWLQVQEPEEAAEIRTPFPLVPVRGMAGAQGEQGHDVLIALDRSVSVWGPSGSDIDGDGTAGRARGGIDLFVDYQQACTDPDDTILAAELQAARTLIESFDPHSTRMGLLSFGGGARVHAPIGSSRSRLLRALQQIPEQAEFGGTSFQNALNLARIQFDGLDGTRAEPRTRTLILLSDGRPTSPMPVENARRFAVIAARDLSRSGVRVFAFALGPEAIGDAEVYRKITDATGGAVYLVDTPAEVSSFAPHVPLAGVERIEIANVTADKPARAVRLYADGGFDGFAPLVPGLNELRITAHAASGDARVVNRRVYFDPSARTDDPEQTAELERILRELQVRTLEAEMSDSARRRMQQRSAGRKLAIDVSDGDGD